jgi:cytochrome P450
MTLVTDLDLPYFDFDDPDLVGDIYHQRLAALRQESWVARSPIALIVLDRVAGEFFLRAPTTAFPGRQIAELFGITAGPLFEHIDANILNLSGATHRRLRSIVARAFTPVAANQWRPVMGQILDQLWAGVEHARRFESVAALAKPYPALTIATILGAPREDASRLHTWSTWVQRQFDIRALSTELARIEAAVVEVYEYVDTLLARPPDPSTLLGALLAAETEGDRLSHVECVNLAVNVLAGAIDTTQSQLSHALHLFATHPDQWALLNDSPDLVSAAVTEVLRVEPVTPFTARLCVEDVEYRGLVFPAGTIVAICAERANREGPSGDQFDISTEPDSRLLTFGAGPHYCLGANLARAELEEALRFLAPRMPGLSLDGPIRFSGIEGIYGIEALPISWST